MDSESKKGGGQMGSNEKRNLTPEKKESHQILRLPDVKRITGLSRSTIYFRMHQGTFPGSVNLGGRAVGWVYCEVQEWVNLRIEASRKHIHQTD